MTDLQICIDQNFTDLSDSEGVLAALIAGTPSIWDNYWSEPTDPPSLIEVQSAISVVQPIKDGRLWVQQVTEVVLGGSADGKTIAQLKAEVVEYDLA